MSVICVICLDKFKSEDVLYGTPCGHVFHYKCISDWLNKSKSCPQCRETVNDGEIKRVFLVFSESRKKSTYRSKPNVQLVAAKSEMKLQKKKEANESAKKKEVAPTVNKDKGKSQGRRASRAPLSTIVDENQKTRRQSHYNLRPR